MKREVVMLNEFKKFVMRGNVLDMAIGIILGAAFGAIVKSLVDDMLMPVVGLLIGNVDFSNLFVVLRAGAEAAGPYATLDAAQKAGAVTLNYGIWLNTVITFLIVSFAIFMLIQQVNRLQKKEEAAPAVPPEPPAQEKLLAEIRDLLKRG
jgi:large conductance mechanosensitive channel